ncbi:Transcription antitermination protein NusB [Candidatus Hartigia pinicola]|nr:Transcription antitermination protein NusB [Candidatus Hartigia pinicola]
MNPAFRRSARECAVQAIYSWQLSDNNISDVEEQFINEQDMSKVDVIYFHALLLGVVDHVITLDQLMKPFLSRQIEELGQIEKAILRIAMYELNYRKDVPYKVTINEGIELAKVFGSSDSHKFINGVLDKVVPLVRYRHNNA